MYQITLKSNQRETVSLLTKSENILNINLRPSWEKHTEVIGKNYVVDIDAVRKDK